MSSIERKEIIMFRNFKDWLVLKIDLITEAIGIKFTRYKGLWEQQNKEIDLMRCSHNKEIQRLKKLVESKDLMINSKNIQIDNLKDEKSKINENYQKYKQKTKEQYLDLMNKYQDSTLKVQDLIAEKRKLSSSKGGLNTKVRYQDKRIKQLETENASIKKLIQQVVKESGRKLTPPTIQELRNYNLYGNKKGKRK
jgi:predicted nuclease with TOPRIM domain